ncbi:MAG: hypothetical protein RXP30_00755 [Thermoplasmata archaeon]|jgi:hypothetical protein|nr:hypothetical protein [Euryarchaeota archaeon]MVT14398.1 hypothetical protein [Euryarchaeota archaeon]MVT35312.1 hypothetical protein [Euryarchaeota archaeon]
MANKRQNKPKTEKNEKDEYIDFLEETLSEFTLAFLLDMERHGIFSSANDEFIITDKFMDKVVNLALENISKGMEADDVIGESIYNAIKDFYGEEITEDEIYPRADIVLSFVLDNLEEIIKENAGK